MNSNQKFIVDCLRARITLENYIEPNSFGIRVHPEWTRRDLDLARTAITDLINAANDARAYLLDIKLQDDVRFIVPEDNNPGTIR